MLIFIEEATAITTAVCAFISNIGYVNPDNVIDVSNDNIDTNISGSNVIIVEGFCVGKNVGFVVIIDVVICLLEKLIILLYKQKWN